MYAHLRGDQSLPPGAVANVILMCAPVFVCPCVPVRLCVRVCVRVCVHMRAGAGADGRVLS